MAIAAKQFLNQKVVEELHVDGGESNRGVDIGVYRALTDLRGWSAERYESWLAGAVDAVIHGSTDA